MTYIDDQRPEADVQVLYWPVCVHHGEVPLQTVAGWSYCDGVGWHDEDGYTTGHEADLAVFELSIERLFARLNLPSRWVVG